MADASERDNKVAPRVHQFDGAAKDNYTQYCLRLVSVMRQRNCGTCSRWNKGPFCPLLPSRRPPTTLVRLLA